MCLRHILPCMNRTPSMYGKNRARKYLEGRFTLWTRSINTDRTTVGSAVANTTEPPATAFALPSKCMRKFLPWA